MTRQDDLFGPALLPGLLTCADVISTDEEHALAAHIDAAGLAPFRFQGWTGKRLTASFGHHYDFEHARLAEAAPIPEWAEPLRERAAAAAGIDPAAVVQLLVTRYDPGAGIGWHRDRPVFGTVVGVSLGASATMRFRRRREGGFDRFSLPLPPCSLYVLGGPARFDWEHSIAPPDATRWSLTFRSLRQP